MYQLPCAELVGHDAFAACAARAQEVATTVPLHRPKARFIRLTRKATSIDAWGWDQRLRCMHPRHYCTRSATVGSPPSEGGPATTLTSPGEVVEGWTSRRARARLPTR